MPNFNLKSYFTFLSRNKAYTAVNIFGLAVSLMFVIIIGLYTWQEFGVNRQHSKAERIYSIGTVYEVDSSRYAGSNHALLRYMQKRYPEIESTCGFIHGSLRLPDRADLMKISTLETDSTFFDFFDYPLLYGDRATCLNSKGNIVITQSLARRYFGTDDAVGRIIMTDDSLRFKVTGVVADFDNTIINKDVDALIDFSYAGNDNYASLDRLFPKGNNSGTATFIMVREGSDFMQKEADLCKYFKSFCPEDNPSKLSTTVTRLDKLYFSKAKLATNLRFGNKKLVNILFAIGVVILLFSIMNYINLTVAQSGYRAREMATRRLFGCSKGGVSRTMFMESLTMCAISCAVAMVFATVLAPYADTLLNTHLDTSLLGKPLTLLIIIAFVIIVSLLAGTLPALTLSEVKPIEVVRGTFVKHTKMVFARVFITVQNVITITMLACALIMSLQMLHVVKAPMGFNTDNLIRLSQNSAFVSKDFPAFLDKLRAMPCVKGLAPSMGTPVEGGANSTITPDDSKTPIKLQYFTVTPDFLKIYGIRLTVDHHLKGDSILYLNDKAIRALRMKPTDTHTSDLFKEFNPWGIPSNVRFCGVFESFRTGTILEPDEPKAIMVCKKVAEPWNLTIQVEGDPVEAYAKIHKAYKSVYHEDIDEESLPLVDRQIAERFDQEVRTSKIVTLFAFVAIVISLLGLVAMSTYFIQQRAKEIAIRKVFGSTSDQVRRRLIRTFLLFVGIAFVIAVPIIVHFMSDWISQYSYRITWWPWIIVAGVIVLLISFAAVAVQSWIAAGENPVKNIKQE